MSARTERITAAINGVKRKMEEKDRRRDALAGELAEKIRELAGVTAARDRLRAFIATPDWGEMSSGADIAAGAVVRFGTLRYSARVAHTKALTRSPLNLIYWEVLEDA